MESIPEEKIIKCYEKNEAFFGSLEDTYERFFESIARVQISSQPFYFAKLFTSSCPSASASCIRARFALISPGCSALP